MPSRRLRRSSSRETSSGEADPDALGRVSARRVVRRQLGVRVADDLAGQLRGPASRVRIGLSFCVAEALEVEVVDDLGDQLVEALDQRDPGVGVAGDAERAQHELAELVGRGDRGGVEAGQRVAQPSRRRAASSSARAVARAGPGASSSPTVDGSSSASAASTSWSRTRSRSSWLAARPNVMSSISSRRRLALGDVAGDQPGEGVGLAGAGAGLEHGGGRAGGQRRRGGRRLRRSHRPPLAAQQRQPQPGGVRAEPGVLALGRLVGAHRPEQCRAGRCSPHTRDVRGVGVLAGVRRCSATS